jgi:hypothetical protein
VIGVKFSEQVKNEMGILFYEEMRGHRLFVPAHQSARKTRRMKNFIEQWFSAEKRYQNKHMIFCHPDERHAHDDYVDSYLLGVYASEQLMTYNRPIMYRENVLKDVRPLKGRSKRYVKALQRLRQVKRGRVADFSRKIKV